MKKLCAIILALVFCLTPSASASEAVDENTLLQPDVWGFPWDCDLATIVEREGEPDVIESSEEEDSTSQTAVYNVPDIFGYPGQIGFLFMDGEEGMYSGFYGLSTSHLPEEEVAALDARIEETFDQLYTRVEYDEIPEIFEGATHYAGWTISTESDAQAGVGLMYIRSAAPKYGEEAEYDTALLFINARLLFAQAFSGLTE